MRCATMGAVLAAILTSTAAPAAAGVITTSCQKNLSDGRILIEDYKVLPSDDATFKVLRYQPTHSDSGWSTGPCTIQVTGPLPPVLNADKVCKGRASIGGPFDRSVYADCLSNEKKLRPSVEARWPAASAKLRQYCLKYSGDAYASLDWCLAQGRTQ